MNSSACTSEPPASGSSRSATPARAPGARRGRSHRRPATRSSAGVVDQGHDRRTLAIHAAASSPGSAIHGSTPDRKLSPLMPTLPPPRAIAEFSDRVAHDLPGLPDDRRPEVVDFTGRRIAGLPSPMRLGVGVVAAATGVGRRPAATRRGRVGRPAARCRCSVSTCAWFVRWLRLHLGDMAGHAARRRSAVNGALIAPAQRLVTDVLIIGSGAGGVPPPQPSSPRPASTCSWSRKDRGSTRTRCARSRSTRWIASTGRAVSRWR